MGFHICERLFVGAKLSMDKIPWEDIDFIYPDRVDGLNLWLRRNPKLRRLFVWKTNPLSEKGDVYLSFILDPNMENKSDESTLNNNNEYSLKEFQDILSSLNVAMFKGILREWNQDVVEPRIYIKHDKC